ncbi:MAG: nucleoside hydrolase [Novosphingobium sp.]
MNFNRRQALSLSVIGAGALAFPLPAFAKADPRRLRVIVDNDLSGDPDGLFQLAHHLRSPSVEIRAIIGSHMHENEPWGGPGDQAKASAARALELLGRLGMDGAVPVIAGAPRALSGTQLPARTQAASAIIAEAMRDDPLPLFYCAGAGLTDLASALLIEPAIAKKMTLIWIGGQEYEALGIPVPNATPAEYNLTIDRVAAQVVFNRSDIAIWQVPRNTYRRMLFSAAELMEMKARGGVSAWLVSEVEKVWELVGKLGMPTGETYVLGDSPLVTLTALQSTFEPDPASSDYVVRPCPTIGDDGLYRQNPAGRPIRVYTTIDTRLTFGDMLAKLK